MNTKATVTVDRAALGHLLTIADQILGAHQSGNNGAYNGEAVLCRQHELTLEHALADIRADGTCAGLGLKRGHGTIAAHIAAESKNANEARLHAMGVLSRGAYVTEKHGELVYEMPDGSRLGIDGDVVRVVGTTPPSWRDEKDPAWLMGWDDNADDKPLAACPFVEPSEEASDWRKGWRAAQDERDSIAGEDA